MHTPICMHITYISYVYVTYVLYTRNKCIPHLYTHIIDMYIYVHIIYVYYTSIHILCVHIM